MAIVAIVVFIAQYQIRYGGHEIASYQQAARIFQDEFGFAPPRSVSGIRINDFRVNDRGRRYMRFRGDEATFQRILGEGFQSTRNWFFVGDSGPIPLWWDHTFSKKVEVGTNFSWHSPFRHTKAYIMRDPQTSTVYFYWYGSPQEEEPRRLDR
jgi:hypothetical protein